MPKLLHRQSEIQKLLFIYALMPVAFITMVFIGITFIQNFGAPAYYVHKHNNELTEVWDKLWEDTTDEMVTLSQSDVVKRFLDGDDSLFTAISEKFYHWNHRATVKSVIHLTDSQGKILYSSATGIEEVIGRLEPIISRIIRLKKPSFGEQNRLPYPFMATSYTIAVPIENGDSGGFLICNLSEADLIKLSSISKDNYYVITDRNQYVVATNYGEARATTYRFDMENVRSALPKLFLRTKGLAQSGLTIHSFYFPQRATLRISSILMFAVIMFFAMAGLALHLSNKVIEQNTRLIKSIVAEIGEETEIAQNDDAYALLSQSYKGMAVKLRNALERNQELIRLKRDTEIRQLESRFHPHFILNVMETLRYVIPMDTRVATETVIILSSLLKYSLYTREDMVPLHIDMQYIDKFLHLYEIRYGDRLSYSIDLDSSVEDVVVPKMLFQPIVENSLKHGYRNKDTLEISIKAFLEDDNLTIEVFDNGGELKPQTLGRLVKEVSGNKAPSDRIGLWTINRRLILLYGKEHGIKISSEKGGFLVRLIIPA